MRNYYSCVAAISALALLQSVLGIARAEMAPKEIRETGQVFSERAMIVKGEGAAPNDRPLSTAQKSILAKRAAKVVALRELAEVVRGVRIAGETFIQDAAASSDKVKADVEGFVQGAELIHESYDASLELAVVFLRLPLDGPMGLLGKLTPAVVSERPAVTSVVARYVAKSKPTAAAEPPKVFDALIVDATGTSFRPALINRILAAGGGLLFDPRTIAPEVLARKGCGDYTNDLGKARAILASHSARNPLVVKATLGPSATDLQVTDADAAAIYAANKDARFLEGARVVFVL